MLLRIGQLRTFCRTGSPSAAPASSTERYCTIGIAFVDSNVLIYTHDRGAGAKPDRGGTICRHLLSERTGCLYRRVLLQLFVTATRLRRTPVVRAHAREFVRAYSLRVPNLTPIGKCPPWSVS
jgi:predicted nucleic acid-binding protein